MLYLNHNPPGRQHYSRSFLGFEIFLIIMNIFQPILFFSNSELTFMHLIKGYQVCALFMLYGSVMDLGFPSHHPCSVSFLCCCKMHLRGTETTSLIMTLISPGGWSWSEWIWASRYVYEIWYIKQWWLDYTVGVGGHAFGRWTARKTNKQTHNPKTKNSSWKDLLKRRSRHILAESAKVCP